MKNCIRLSKQDNKKGFCKMYRYSIITPVYNSEKYLPKCIESVISQTYKTWEFIMIDDGSKDNSFSIMKKYAQKDDRIIIIKKDNEGPGLTRNLGMQMTTGDYIVFLDSDDYIESNFLEEVNKEALKGNDVIFIDIYQEKPDRTLIKYENMSDFKNLSKHDLISTQMTGKMPWGGWRKVSKKSIIVDNEIKFTADVVGEEAVFSFDLLTHAENISFIEKHLYHYVNYPQSQSKSSGAGWIFTAKNMKQHLQERGLLDNYRQALNSFAYTALCGRLLTLVKTEKYSELKQKMKLFTDDFEKEYGWDINKRYLRKEPKLMITFLRKRWYLLPVIGGKLFVALNKQ